MRHRLVFALSLLAMVSIILVGCSQPTPTPTQASSKAAEPTKAAAPAAQPTTAPAAQPTAAAAPAKKVDFPQKGKAITIIVPWSAGGTNDITARILAPLLENELGTPVTIVNKAGAASQIGLTEVALAKPDGYTLALMVIPPAINVYLNPDLKPQFNRESFVPIAVAAVDPMALSVKGDSPYKTTKELVDAAKANPEKVRVGSTGIASTTHLLVLQLQKATGVRFARVQFEGDPQAIQATLGGHIDAMATSPATILGQYKSGGIRVLGYTDKEQSKFFPDVPGFPGQGYDVYFLASRGIAVPKGTPQEIVTILGDAMKKVVNSEEFKKKCDDAGLLYKYMDQKAYIDHWDQTEVIVKPLLPDLMEPAKK